MLVHCQNRIVYQWNTSKKNVQFTSQCLSSVKVSSVFVVLLLTLLHLICLVRSLGERLADKLPGGYHNGSEHSECRQPRRQSDHSVVIRHCLHGMSCNVKVMDELRTVLVVYLSVPFLLKSSYTLLRIMLETICTPPPLTSLICEIKTRGLILWKYQVILVIEYLFIIKGINYAL